VKLKRLAAAAISFLLLWPVGAVSLVWTALPARAAAQDFRSWLHDLKAEAAQHGISRSVIDRALPDTLTPNQHILTLDREQPESDLTLAEYLRNVVTSDRAEKGRERMQRNSRLLSTVESAYHVDREAVVALWGIETTYGEHTGGYETVPALATLAYDGRRGGFFRDQLMLALKILDEGDVRPAQMKGSWAGAMGQNQFMPSSFFKFAVDFDKDGRRDIWNSRADVFASTANYLASNGWKKGVPWGRKVKLPAGFDRHLLGLQPSSLKFWQDKGVRLANGKVIPFEGEVQGAVLQPDGPGTQAYLVYDNYKVFLTWNKSTYFGIAAGLLSDRLSQ
jgi:membrane-bound lytic murein transglycosylase B